MKHFLSGCVLIALSFAALAEVDPSERYLEAYFLIQEADEATAASTWAAADAKFSAALQVLNAIQSASPSWHASLVQFRIKYCNDRLTELRPKLPVASPVTPPAEVDQVRQLQAELQAARENARKLEETRDKLAGELQAKLKEPAPSDRQSARQTLDQLHALQAVNDALTAQLEAARQRADRADQIEKQLQQSQERIRGLEGERTGLNAKLQDALGKLSATQPSPQLEALMKKNAELTAQLASTQAQITQMRDEMATTGGDSSAETVKLRAQVGQLGTELEQTKTLLVQRTEELKTTRVELEQVRAENVRLGHSFEELNARLNENERQLRAARASTDKDNEIIQQLRQENALLREISTNAQAKATSPKAKGGFLWFKPKQPATPPPVETGSSESVSKSEAGKLTAAVKAPARPEATPPPSAPVESATATNGSPIVQRLLADARAAIAHRDLEGAAAKFQSVLDQDPENVAALTNLGVIHYQQNRLEPATELLQKAVSLKPNDSQSRSVLGVVYFRKGRVEDAYGELTRAVALNPRNSEAHNYLGIVMSEKGWATAAEQEVRRAIELNPEYADAHFNLAVIYSRQKTPRTELARYHYQRARELGSDRDAQLETSLGMGAPAK